MQVRVSKLYRHQSRVFVFDLLLAFVISPFLANIAALILVTSAPPGYCALFISQFITTRSQGLGPCLYYSTF